MRAGAPTREAVGGGRCTTGSPHCPPGLHRDGRRQQQLGGRRIARARAAARCMAGDPHLHLTLPAIWFQLTQDSPGYHTAGVSIPGTPVVADRPQPAHLVEPHRRAEPADLLLRGEGGLGASRSSTSGTAAGRSTRTVSYDIPVLGGADRAPHREVQRARAGHQRARPDHLGVVGGQHPVAGPRRAAAHRPGQQLPAVPRRAARLVLAHAQLRLRGRPGQHRPHLGRATTRRSRTGQPWLPMPGTGEYDVTGTIPYDEIPQVYNPPGGVVWSANQRQVTADYPYYIGTASNFFDPGYRANEIHRVLERRTGKLTRGRHDGAADRHARLPRVARSCRCSSARWPSDSSPATTRPRSTSCRAGTTGWTRTPPPRRSGGSSGSRTSRRRSTRGGNRTRSRSTAPRRNSTLNDMLGQDLEAWTLRDQTNPAFTLGRICAERRRRDAGSVRRRQSCR